MLGSVGRRDDADDLYDDLPSAGVRHPAGPNQERYLLAERFTHAAYPIPFSYRIVGEVDPARLQAAIDAVVARHAVLRARLGNDAGGFFAEILPEVHIPLRQDWRRDASPEAVRARIAAHFGRKPTSFEPQELVQALLITTAPDAHVLTLSLHHAVGDGVSMDIFAGEIFAAYAGQPLPAAPRSFYDVLAAAPRGLLDEERDQAYWAARLGGIAEVASLRADRDDPDAHTGEVVATLDFARTQAAAAALGVSPFVLMTALTSLVLGRFAGSDDVLLTLQSSGRKPYPASAGVIGPFSNTVPLRARIDPAEPFAALARRTADDVAEALRHEALPYHRIVRETGVQPSFGINWFPTAPAPRVPGLTIAPREFLFYESNYDLNIRFVRDGAMLQLLLHHDARSIGGDRAAQVAAALAAALDAVAQDPGLAVGTVLAPPAPLAVPAARAVPRERLFDAFLGHAARHPDRAAITGAGGTISYGELEAQSAALGRRLLAAGLGAGSWIAILAERGPQLVVSILAVLRIGATMVPLDGDYPEERLRTLVGVARPEALLLPRRGATPTWAEGVGKLVFAEDPAARIPDAGLFPPARLAAGDPEAPAYVLFTSGSTGTPKGIATGHRPVLNFLAWQRDTFGLTADDRFTNLCGVAHDMMIRDIFAPLSMGASLAIPAQETIFRPGALRAWMEEQAPTVTHLTPAMGRLLAMANGAPLPLRRMFFGGDRLTQEVVAAARSVAPDAEIVNFYGATETPQAAAFHRADPGAKWRTFPIGRGIDGFALRIVDGDRRPVVDGAPGEIAVLSPWLSLGYVREGRIIPHPAPGCYFTGDTGFVLPSGEVMFTGRNDDQVSIRGYRIELEEITAALAAHPAVREAQVLVEGGDNPRLVGFAAGDALDPDALYAWLTARLPGYMVPGEIVPVPALPLLPNGKLDRRALLALPRPARDAATVTAPTGATEAALIAAWKPHLGDRAIGTGQSFAELRGDSLAFVQVFLATEAVVGPLPDDWPTRPIAELAALAKGGVAAPQPRWFKLVDSAMLVRAAAIAVIVAFHLKLMSWGGGATSALLMVSGFLIGRLQLREAARTRSADPFWAIIVRVGLPTMLYTTLFYLARLALGKPASLSVLLLTSDFVDYRNRADALAHGEAFFLWYICAFLHMMLAIGVVTWAVVRFTDWRLEPKRFAAWLFVASLPLKFVLPGLFDPGFFVHGIEPLSFWGYTPTSHLSTLLLGVCLAGAETRRERLGWLGITFAYALATWAVVPSNSFAMMAAVGVLLLFVPRLPLPRGLHMIVLYLSGASLFIYLTHQQAAQALEFAGVPRDNWLMAPAAILVGVAVWYVWQKVSPLARRLSPI